jgi:hypothetical protein
MSLQNYRNIISQNMLQSYLHNIEKLNVDYEHYEILSRIISTYPSEFNDKTLIDDPIIVLLLLMRDSSCSRKEVITLFLDKMNLCEKRKMPRLVRKYSEESINDIVERYLNLTPKRILKNISDDDISDISRRSSIDSMASPIVNY